MEQHREAKLLSVEEIPGGGEERAGRAGAGWRGFRGDGPQRGEEGRLLCGFFIQTDRLHTRALLFRASQSLGLAWPRHIVGRVRGRTAQDRADMGMTSQASHPWSTWEDEAGRGDSRQAVPWVSVGLMDGRSS